VLQRSGVVKAARLALQQRQVVQRIEDLLLASPAPFVAGDPGPSEKPRS
jgi:hypothetical protein